MASSLLVVLLEPGGCIVLHLFQIRSGSGVDGFFLVVREDRFRYRRIITDVRLFWLGRGVRCVVRRR